MKAELTVDCVADPEDFAALTPEWWDLWRRTSSATPFQSPAWLIPWWRHFHPGGLFAVTVRSGGRLIGLAPFYIEEGPLGRRILPIGMSVSDYLDVLIDPAFAGAAGNALVAYLVSNGEHWDGWDLEELAPDAGALRLPAPATCEEQLAEQSACPVLTFPDRLKDFKAWIPPRKRRHLNLGRNRAARRGPVAIQQADSETTPCLLDTVFRLHRARWESRGEAGVLADESVQNFQRAAIPALQHAGLLRLYVLCIGGEPAAAYYGFMQSGRAYSYLTGLNPDFAFESPGNILLAHALEQALAEGAREFHFLRGREAYKYEWGAVDRWNMRRSFRWRGERQAHA